MSQTNNTSDRLRIVFFGTTDFASYSLRALKDSRHEIVGVVTTPDRPQGRHLKLVPCDVKSTAETLGITPILEPEKLKDGEFLDALRQLEADLFVVIAFRMLPEAVWSMPKLGTVNIHGSLLPAYRGAAPINRAIMAGETETGVTAFRLNHEIDAGEIIDTRSTQIGNEENFGSLYNRLMRLGADLLIDVVDKLASGDTSSTPQEKIPVSPTPAPKIFTEDCIINFRQTAKEIHNQIRGLSPQPGAFATLTGATTPPVKIKILSARISDSESGEISPGKVTIEGKKMTVDCADRRIEVLSVQPAGKKEMDIKAYLNGARLVDPWLR